MSMIGTFQRATDAEIQRLLADPQSVIAFVRGPGDAFEDRSDTHIEKTWHGLHYLFTGTAWGGEPPLNFLVAGGARIGDVEVGYDTVRAFTSQQVREIAAALASLTADDLSQRFDPGPMNDLQIYPSIWTRNPAEDDLGYLAEYFEILKRYVSTVAADGLGMLVYIT
jgi:hypothetical protein